MSPSVLMSSPIGLYQASINQCLPNVTKFTLSSPLLHFTHPPTPSGRPRTLCVVPSTTITVTSRRITPPRTAGPTAAPLPLSSPSRAPPGGTSRLCVSHTGARCCATRDGHRASSRAAGAAPPSSGGVTRRRFKSAAAATVTTMVTVAVTTTVMAVMAVMAVADNCISIASLAPIMVLGSSRPQRPHRPHPPPSPPRRLHPYPPKTATSSTV